MPDRPKTLQQARSTYSTNSEIFWWIFMRISGLALVFLVFGHPFFNNIQINVNDVDYNYVASRFSKSWVKGYDSFLLGFAMLHGVNGLRYSIEDYIKIPSRRFWTKDALFTIAAIILVLGVITLWAFTFEEMGDAIRALPGD